MFFINPFILSPAGGDFESIATVTVGSGGAAEVEFTSIASSWTHLQIRFIGHFDDAGSSANPQLRLNDDAGSNYSYHMLYGNGTSAAAEAGSSLTQISTVGQAPGDSVSANIFGASVIDILDYANTSKNTTVRSFGGSDRNGAGSVRLSSGCFIDTSAVTSIQLFLSSGNWAEHSTFALYGVKAP